MENEIRNENELLEVEVLEPADEEFEESNGLFGKIAAGVGVVALGVGTTLIVKNKERIKAKIEERKIRKLEEKGYVIYRPEEVEYEDVDEEIVEEK